MPNEQPEHFGPKRLEGEESGENGLLELMLVNLEIVLKFCKIKAKLRSKIIRFKRRTSSGRSKKRPKRNESLY